jgi:hypothetical protein
VPTNIHRCTILVDKVSEHFPFPLDMAVTVSAPAVDLKP